MCILIRYFVIVNIFWSLLGKIEGREGGRKEGKKVKRKGSREEWKKEGGGRKKVCE